MPSKSNNTLGISSVVGKDSLKGNKFNFPPKKKTAKLLDGYKKGKHA